MYQIILLVLFLPYTISLSFNFTRFDSNNRDIVVTNDSFISGGEIQLTKNQQDSQLTSSVGRAYYYQPVQLWNKNTKKVTDFTTHFTFVIKPVKNDSNGDGLTFFLVPVGSTAPIGSTGRGLGLVNSVNYTGTTNNQFVAVEFDSFKNVFDPSADHIGIDVNSVVSVANVTLNTSIKNGLIANAWVTYDSSSKNLSVFLNYANNSVSSGNSILSYIIDLSSVLPEKVLVGFSAGTGTLIEIHSIHSWDFNSTLPDADSKVGVIVGVVTCIVVLLVLLGALWCILSRRRVRQQGAENDEIDFEVDEDDDFEKGTGPRRFTYHEISRATNNFSEDGKLGEGGFGGVYRGLLSDPSREIAVKKISSESKQGKKEYVSEVRIISRLRHRNLVQLLGWSHEQGELLLVYELMPNASLDYHLYGGKKASLQWTVRYKIAHGLASALLYLHEEWEQCVVHRDIKASNVMLDSAFNAKLGDFGLARLVDHGLGSQTTVLAGTLGYMAPECLITGSSKESDVYAFGVVALEIACGRRPVEQREEPSKVRLIEWVWTLYGEGHLLAAVDNRLDGEFDIQQVECLMMVGLWCCHPDYSQRPSIRQVLNVLSMDSPLPNLPSKLPVPSYCAPPMNMDGFSMTSSSGYTGSTATTSS